MTSPNFNLSPPSESNNQMCYQLSYNFSAKRQGRNLKSASQQTTHLRFKVTEERTKVIVFEDWISSFNKLLAEIKQKYPQARKSLIYSELENSITTIKSIYLLYNEKDYRSAMALMRIVLEDISATIKIDNQHEDSYLWLKTEGGQKWLINMSNQRKLHGRQVVIPEHYQLYENLCAYVHPSKEKYWEMILDKEYANNNSLLSLDFGRTVHSICMSLYSKKFPKLGYKQKFGCSICGSEESLLSHRFGFGFVCDNCLGIIEDGKGDSLLYIRSSHTKCSSQAERKPP
jgi:hypothetical protein